ncbi:MAG: hypothetical protein GXY33_18860 [Phycisphaerae bacterium]|nr:hypothetical protein [Phycisphaerae bacterium]
MTKGRRSGSLKITTRQYVQMLSPEVEGKLKHFHMHHCMQDYRCPMKPDDHGPSSLAEPIIPYLPAVRARVYTGTRSSGSYCHHPQITKFKGRYFLSWSNGIRDEEAAGQRVLISSSKDGLSWSEPAVIVGGRNGTTLAHNSVGLSSTKDALLAIVMEEACERDASVVGMRRIDPATQQVRVYRSTDGCKWKKAFDFTDNLRWFFEAPRLTDEGRLLCAAAMKDGPAILLWPGKELCKHPEVIRVPEPQGAVFPYGEGTWYKTDDGRIVVFWRDEGQSCRVWVNTSDDHGRTFTAPAISDIPDSMSRLSAGRLADGRYYLCNNAFPTLLNRMHLLLLLSDDGLVFDKAYVVADDPTSQRLFGLLKADGYQYPCCFADRDKLLIAHSVNKEDIECAVVADTTAI